MHGAEPGTGTQYASHATPPSDDSRPNGIRLFGTYWKVGHDYLDTEIGDVCELVEVVSKSSWCDTRDAEDCPKKLVFAYERYSGMNGNTIEIDPSSLEMEDGDRFIERYTAPAPRGAPSPPW
ncbi:hypothetical protein M199_gp086 [Halogranum tailed virus 1]|uniref:Uncharacterized protein n=1 Tax=Halogranum tailed virus 1 TaxID=1273749 RepID=R4T9H6_9CAUD|nr:hypothetical protein M199_gp086 [Halogranum tailed virus 1]AGM11580.1 hypothetical protein HGTV1_283 [Halogranum tailed virus 1]